MKILQKLLVFLFITVSFFIENCYSQESIVVAGGKGLGSGGIFSYSVGQVTNLSLKGNGWSAHEGVQHAYEIATLGKDEFTDISLMVTAYPNPTTDILNLIVSNEKFDNLSYSLFDISGKILSQILKIESLETNISMHGLPQGVYFLKVNSTSKAIKTFKIIKK